MKRHIIISGDKGTGKTWISNAIASTHDEEKVLKVSCWQLKSLSPKNLKSNFQLAKMVYNIIIIDECNKNDINKFAQLLDNIPSIIPFVGFGKNSQLQAIFLSQDLIQHGDYPERSFHLIKC